MLSVSFVTQQVRLNNVHRLICNHYTIRQSDNLIVLLIGAENLHPNGYYSEGELAADFYTSLCFVLASMTIIRAVGAGTFACVGLLMLQDK